MWSFIRPSEPLNPRERAGRRGPHRQSAYGPQPLDASQADDVSAGLDVSAHVASYAFAGATPLAREAALYDGAGGEVCGS